MSIPDYFQEIHDFRSPHGHINQPDFVAEGLTEIAPASGNLVWNASGLAVINQIISARFEVAIELYDLMGKLAPMLPDSQIARQLVARGYYAMFWAGRALSLTLCRRDWGMGRGNHGNLPTHLSIHTRTDRWYPYFDEFLTKWRSFRNCADYNQLTVLVYSGRYAGRRPRRVPSDYDNLDEAAAEIGNFVEEYLHQSQRLISRRGVHLVRTI